MITIKQMSIALVVLVASFSARTAVAADGVCGGKNTPLTLSSSTVSDGEKNVEPGREIKLVFSKNISNITVKEANRTCFSMSDSAGREIPLEVVLFDDQLEREKRNDVLLKPTYPTDSRTYVITVGGALKAKNGASLEGDVVIGFTLTGSESGSGRGRFPVVMVVPVAFLFVSIAYFIHQRAQAE